MKAVGDARDSHRALLLLLRSVRRPSILAHSRHVLLRALCAHDAQADPVRVAFSVFRYRFIVCSR